MALDADSRLIISYLVGTREVSCGVEFMKDLAARLAQRVQLTTDGYIAYPEAVYAAFGKEVDFGVLVKEFEKGDPHCFQNVGYGLPDPAKVSTSYAERQNFSMRTRMRHFTRKTNGYSKSLTHHASMVDLYFLHYNFCMVLKHLGGTLAQLAGLAPEPWGMEWIVELVEEFDPPAGPRGPYKKRKKKVQEATQVEFKLAA